MSNDFQAPYRILQSHDILIAPYFNSFRETTQIEENISHFITHDIQNILLLQYR